MMHQELWSQLFKQHFNEDIASIHPIAQNGSNRQNFKITSQNHTVIGTYNENIAENESFIYLSNHFYEKNLAVPKVLIISDDRKAYLQSYLGDLALFDIVQQDGFTKNTIALYQKTIQFLANIQIDGAENLDFTRCYPVPSFNKQAILWDLDYFKYYFLKLLDIPFNEQLLQKEFNILADFLSKENHQYFMYRDFQSRNIIVNNNEVFGIDFQGGRKGSLQYDIAALLWQAKAKIPHNLKVSLFNDYVAMVQNKINIDKTAFTQQYYGFVLIRLLQVLGAYGLRGLIEKKQHFIDSIPFALENIKWFLDNRPLQLELPHLFDTLDYLYNNNSFINKNEVKQSKLTIEINSFSFKRAIPTNKEGGGFVFDCRGILNPGRFAAYKTQNGKDKAVIDFLESKTNVKQFLEHAWKTIDISIDNYIERDFENLQINFGCTGGQHRSVYCAEKTAQYIQQKYPNVTVKINHIERELNGEFI
ncbi:MAG: phosphotransferase [Chitinophagales bacterium]|nr:phosphotransferase [Chitinophagales bacterium]